MDLKQNIENQCVNVATICSDSATLENLDDSRKSNDGVDKNKDDKENCHPINLTSNEINKKTIIEELLKRKRKLQEQLRNDEATLVLLKRIRTSQQIQQVNGERKGNISLTNGQFNQTHEVSTRPKQQQPPPQVPPMQSIQSQKQARIMAQLNQHKKAVISEQVTAQNRAAAKLALRKELETTLLQIPPPKPPPPEMNFMPSLGTSEFGMLLGLEEAVKVIRNVSTEKSDIKYIFNPFTCIQCLTDYTPVWKRDKPGSKSVICEQCVTSNKKKELKQEHTNRLKSAFVKALKREQEIEKKLSQGLPLAKELIGTTNIPSKTQNSSSSNSSNNISVGGSRRSTERVMERHSRSNRPTSHHSSSSKVSSSSSSQISKPVSRNNDDSSSIQAQVQAALNFQTIQQQQALASLANYKITPEQIRQQQQMLMQAQLQMLQQQNFNSRMASQNFSPQQLAKMAELQRQFFMDMMPSLGSRGAGSGLWKT